MTISKIEKQIAGIVPWESTPSGHDYSIRPNWIDLGLDFNSIPYKSDTIIIVTSWWGHLQYMKATLKKYRESGAFVLLAYDFPIKSWESDSSFYQKFPSSEILLLPHSFVTKHITFDNDKRNGWLWLILYAYGIAENLGDFDYVLTVNSDCIWEKPEGLDDLKKELGEADLMSVTSLPDNIHTCAVIYKKKAFLGICDYIKERLRTPILGSWSPEKLLTEAVRTKNMIEKVAPIQPMELDNSSIDYYSRYGQDSTWKRLVGYKNLGAEFLTCLVERTEPPNPEYIDLELMRRICPGFSESLFMYYQTRDRRHLYQAWDYNESSWYDRVYYPIEYYGKEPVYEIDPNNKFELTKFSSCS